MHVNKLGTKIRSVVRLEKLVSLKRNHTSLVCLNWYSRAQVTCVAWFRSRVRNLVFSSVYNSWRWTKATDLLILFLLFLFDKDSGVCLFFRRYLLNMLISESGTFKIQVHNFILNATATILNLLADIPLFIADVDHIHCSVRHSSVIRAALQSNWNRIHPSVSGDLQVSVATNLLLRTERKQCGQSFNPFQHPPYTPL